MQRLKLTDKNGKITTLPWEIQDIVKVELEVPQIYFGVRAWWPTYYDSKEDYNTSYMRENAVGATTKHQAVINFIKTVLDHPEQKCNTDKWIVIALTELERLEKERNQNETQQQN